MESKSLWGFIVLAVLTSAIIISGMIAPAIFYNNLFLCFILILTVILGISATYSFKFPLFRILSWIFFFLAVIANIFWFFILEFTFQFQILYFFIINLCIVFMYALLFIVMPSYANRYQHKYELSSIKGYHIHENIYGIIFVLFGLFQFILSWLLPNPADPLNFWLYHFFLFFGTACTIVGAFLIGRDYTDLLHFRFIERRDPQEINLDFTIREHYYRIGKFGIVLTLFGLIFFFHHELWGQLFFSNPFFFTILGLVLIISGALIFGINFTYFAKKVENT